jgi:hypothetical protein
MKLFIYLDLSKLYDLKGNYFGCWGFLKNEGILIYFMLLRLSSCLSDGFLVVAGMNLRKENCFSLVSDSEDYCEVGV